MPAATYEVAAARILAQTKATAETKTNETEARGGPLAYQTWTPDGCGRIELHVSPRVLSQCFGEPRRLVS